MSYYLEPYAELINILLPCFLILATLLASLLHCHIVTHVTPRVDAINGFKTTRRFKINAHQTEVYRRCFTHSNQKIRKLFRAKSRDMFLFKCDKYLARGMIVLITICCSFLKYTHGLVF